LDLVLDLSDDNAKRAIRALAELGYRPRAPVPAEDFVDPEKRLEWARGKGMTVFALWSDRFRELEVDLFVTEPFDFDAAWSRSVRVDLDSTTATVVGLQDLVALKEEAGRPIDRADIEALRQLAIDESHDSGDG
jgi:hypothetical protein